MKLYPQISLLLFISLISAISLAQVGVNTSNPKTMLEVNGAISLREGAPVSLADGVNDNITLGATPFSFHRIISPTRSFSITGIVPATGSNGQIVTLENTTSHAFTISHDAATSIAANRIYCPGEKDFTLTGKYASVTLQYNETQNGWILIDYVNNHYGNNLQSVIVPEPATGVQNITTSGGFHTDIEGATITFTPRHSKVYLSFAISGYNPLSGGTGAEQQSWFSVRVLNDAAPVGNFVSISAATDDLSGAVGAATVTAANFPLDVVPNVPVTINLQGTVGGVTFDQGFTVDTVNYTSFLTILD